MFPIISEHDRRRSTNQVSLSIRFDPCFWDLTRFLPTSDQLLLPVNDNGGHQTMKPRNTMTRMILTDWW